MASWSELDSQIMFGLFQVGWLTNRQCVHCLFFYKISATLFKSPTPTPNLPQGEEFGYLGSRRFAADISPSGGTDGTRMDGGGFSCENHVSADDTASGYEACLDPVYPNLAFTDISLDDVQHVIALDQVGLGSADGQFYTHTTAAGSAGELGCDGARPPRCDPTTTPPPHHPTTPPPHYPSTPSAASALSSSASSSGGTVSSSSTSDLPSSPLTSFLRAREGGSDALSGVVLSGYVRCRRC